MTGRCYYCSKGEHHECSNATCTCCGSKYEAYQAKVEVLYQAMKVFLAAKRAEKRLA